ncbi:protocadherin Fat 4 isoform X1 [Hydra vulgaris]|uniref:protocadherin Fat 4 isoform X1 n=1 Tax=Hydra vulgaris TaxID=6087 RepID=UPI001F5E9F71|nr:protocadherin Fat 4 [Hydra vulgaris]
MLFPSKFLLIIFIKETLSCSPSCKPKDCILSNWSSWTLCSASCGPSGARQRTRFVQEQPECNGNCNKALKETENCNTKCCPTNCTFTYGDWSPCIGCGLHGTRSRAKSIQSPASCGGFCLNTNVEIESCDTKRCCPVDCTVSEWTSWSSCFAACEKTAIVTRLRTVQKQDSCNGKSCPVLNEANSCNGPTCCPRDCEYSDWSAWEVCSGSCQGGTQKRKRSLTKQATCNGTCSNELFQTKACIVKPVKCQLSSWESWSSCSSVNGKCGNGTQMRVRTIVVKPVCDNPCGNLNETKNCLYSCCPVNCEYGQWGKWSNCSNQCGSGLRSREREVQTKDECGGLSCSQSDLKATEFCTENNDLDCILTKWSSWFNCSTECGSGFSQRNRSIIQQPKCNGKLCESLFESKTCISYNSNQDCVVSLWGAWGTCQSNCSLSTMKRVRNILSPSVCMGKKCPYLEETVPCGEVNGGCEHVCYRGVCSCSPGYTIKNQTKCVPKDCGLLTIDLCKSSDQLCKNPSVLCPGNNTLFPTLCKLECPLGFKLFGKDTVSCQSSGQWTQTQSICNSLNEPPSQIILSKYDFSENLPSGFQIGVLYSVDKNKNDTHTYTLIKDDCGCFTILENQLKTLKVFNYEEEKNAHFQVTIRSTDNGYPPLSIEESFQLFLNDVNEKPLDILLSSNSIKENSKEDVLVGKLDAVDVDANQTFLYRMVDSSHGLFVIDNNELKTSSRNMKCIPPTYPQEFCPLNFEIQKVHYITIEVYDNGVPSLSFIKNFSIYLLDINDPPYNLILSSNSVKENSLVNTFIGQFSAQDEENQTLSFLLLDDDNSNFILSSAKLYKSKSSDYEATKSHFIHVQVSDDGDPINLIDKWFIINVEDENEPPVNVTFVPTFQVTLLNLTVINIFENTTANNFNVGKFVIYDADKIQSIEVELLETFNGTFVLDNSTHSKCIDIKEKEAQSKCEVNLFINKNLDFESKSVYSINIKITDRNHSIQYIFQVNVIDCNDAPISILINDTKVASIYENSFGVMIGKLTTVDQDFEQQYEYKLFDSFEYFEIVGNILMLKKNISTDYESQSFFVISIISTDNGNPSQYILDQVRVNILDVNDPPTNVTLSVFEIDENLNPDTLFANVIIIDQDVKAPDYKSHPCFLSNNTYFKIVENVLYVLMPANFEQASFIYIHLICQDQFVQVKNTFIVTVNDVNEAPSEIILSTHEYSENLPPQLIATLFTVDPDVYLDGNQHVFTYKILTNQDQVAVNGSNLLAIKTFNFEVLSLITFEIQVIDSGGLTLSQLKTIKIVDQNDPPSDILISSDKVYENSVQYTLVGSLTVIDEDQHQSFICILNGSKSSPLEIYGSHVMVAWDGSRNDHLNFEKNPLLSLPVVCTDNGNPRYSIYKSFTIYVLDENDPPYNLTLSNYYINETDPIGTIIGKFNALDEDIGQSLSFFIVGGDSQYFKIEAQYLIKFANFTQTGVYKIIVEVIDNGSPPMKIKSNFLIDVINVNEAPIATVITSEDGLLVFNDNFPSINENCDIGSVVGTIFSYDPDKNATLNITLDNTESGIFALDNKIFCYNTSSLVDGTTCKVKLLVNSYLDYEEASFHPITIRSQDQNGLLHVQKFVITVFDMNDKPTNVFLNGLHNVAVCENIQGVFIADITTMDQDANQSFIYTLSETYALEVFEIDSNRLFLKSNISLDYEQESVYNFSIVSTDSGTPQKNITVRFSVNVEDVNEAPILIEVSNLSVAENSPSTTFIGSITVKDPDNIRFVTQYHECWVTGSFLLFNIQTYKNTQKNIVNELYVMKNGLDYEVASFFTITISCKDSGNPSLIFQQNFNISVIDVNEAPYAILLSANSILENTNPTVIGSFSTRDPDNVGSSIQLFNYTLLNESVPFEIIGHELKTKQELDYEFQSNWIIFVKSTDNGNPSLSFIQNFTIFVIDVNEAPTDILLSSSQFEENSQKDTVVSYLTAIDVDRLPDGRNQKYTFSLTENFKGVFRIISDQLQIAEDYNQCSKTNSCFLNFEKNPLLQLKIKVTDDGVPVKFYEKSISVQLKDVNDPPWNLTLSSNLVKENSPIGFEIGIFSAQEEDLNQSLKFYLINDTSGLFEIRSNGSLVIKKNPNFEMQEIYVIKVEVVDDGNPSLSNEKSFSIFVQDINEAPAELHISDKGAAARFFINEPEIFENLPPDTVLGTLEAIDHDYVELLTFDLLDSHKYLRLKPNSTTCTSYTQGQSGSYTVCDVKVMTNTILNFEETASFIFTVKVKDNQNLTHLQSFKLKVIDRNDAPTNITLQGKHDAFVSENDLYTAIGTLDTTDEDVNQTFIYSVINNSHFAVVKSINGESQLYTSYIPLDYEKVQNHTINILSIDSGSPALSFLQQIVIHVLDVNEAPSEIILSKLHVFENLPPNTVVGLLSVIDPDVLSSQTHSCSIDNFKFVINNASLLTLASLDYEMSSHETINIVCTDSGSPPKSLQKIFTINVEDVNESPKEILLTNNNVPENCICVFGHFSVIDPDKDDSHNLTITSGMENFEILGSEIKSKDLLNFENRNEYLIEVLAMDLKGLFIKKTFKIFVEDRNDPPSNLECTLTNIPETSPFGTFIGECVAVDDDNYQIHNFFITQTFASVGLKHIPINNTVFKIDSTSGALVLGATKLNYWYSSSYVVTIMVTDNGSPQMSFEKNITIIIEDVLRLPTDILLSQKTVQENSLVGTFVGTVDVIDPDNFMTDKYSHFCNLTESTTFEINDNHELVVKSASLDFETTMLYEINVTCFDLDFENKSISRIFFIQVLNINEAPSITLTPSLIDENNKPGSVIAFFDCRDPDNLNTIVDNLTITSINSYGGQFALLFPFYLVSNIQLDYENISFYTLEVTVTDDGKPPLSLTKNISININNLNEAPTSLSLSSTSFYESQLPGTIVTSIFISDPDPNQNHTCKILDDANFFSMNGSADIKLTNKVDYETISFLSIVVECFDNGSPPLSIKQNFTINILDSNDQPSAINYNISSVLENANFNQLVAQLIVEDQDQNQSHLCEAQGTNKHWFYFSNETNGKIFVFLMSEIMKLNYETEKSISVIVICHDNGTPPLSIQDRFEFFVIDVNEPATKIFISNSSFIFMNENVVPGTRVGLLECDDPDVGQEIKYNLLEDSNLKFQIYSGNILVVKNLSMFDFESSEFSRVIVNIQVSDTSNQPIVYNGTLEIIAQDVNEPPSNIKYIVNNLISDIHFIGENSTIGSSIGLLLADNPEGSVQMLTFSLLTYKNYFLISYYNNSSSDLVLVKELDVNDISDFTISVKVSDNGIPPLSTVGYIRLTVLRSDPCVSGMMHCTSNSECARKNKTTGECLCLPGFEMNLGVCQQIDDCKPSCQNCLVSSRNACLKNNALECSPCRNDGICTDLHMNYSCECKKGFTGLDCAVDIDDCAPKPCLHNSICEDKFNNYSCHCAPGYKGNNCEEEINECEQNPCYNGNCTDQIDGFLCTCPLDYYGTSCQRYSKFCTLDKCSENFECVPNPISKKSEITFRCVPKNRILSLFIEDKFAVLSPDTAVSLWKLRFENFLLEKVTVPSPWLESKVYDKYVECKINDAFILNYESVEKAKTNNFYIFENVTSKMIENQQKTIVRFFAVVQNEVLAENVLLYSINKTCEELYVECAQMDKMFGCKICRYVNEFLAQNSVLKKPEWGKSKRSREVNLKLIISACILCAVLLIIIFLFKKYKPCSKNKNYKVYKVSKKTRTNTFTMASRSNSIHLTDADLMDGQFNLMYGVDEEELQRNKTITPGLYDLLEPDQIFSKQHKTVKKMFDNPLFHHNINKDKHIN